MQAFLHALLQWLRALFAKKWLKIPVFIVSLYPLADLIWRQYKQDLGANPAEYILHSTGESALQFLAITLAITPVRKMLGMPELIRYRRMMGLFAFFYGFTHLMSYISLDKQFSLREIIADIVKRPFITFGMLSFTVMVPLAMTSTAGWIRRMGGKRWQQLHRLTYVAAVAGVVHYYMLVKADVTEPLMYGATFGVIFLARLEAIQSKVQPFFARYSSRA